MSTLRRLWLLIGAVLLILVAGLLIWRGQPDRTLDTPVSTPAAAPVGEPAVAGTGIVEPSSEAVRIGAFAPGIVEAVYVREGDRVAKGQALFVLDRRSASAAVTQAKAELVKAQAGVTEGVASLALAKRQLALYADVEDPRAISRTEVIERRGTTNAAEARLASAQAAVAGTRAALEAAQVALAQLTVRAPIAGEVLQVNTRAGEYATAGPAAGQSNPLVTLGQTRPLHVRVDIDENEAARILTGRPAIVSPRGAPGTRFRVAYVRTVPQITPKQSLTNSADERVDVRVLQLLYAADPSTGLRVGQQVDAFVPARPVAGRR